MSRNVAAYLVLVALAGCQQPAPPATTTITTITTTTTTTVPATTTTVLTRHDIQTLAIAAVRLTMESNGYDVSDFTDSDIAGFGRQLCDILDIVDGDRAWIVTDLTSRVEAGELTLREGLLAAAILGVAEAWCPRWEF